MSLEAHHFIQPDWPAPATVRAVTTTRQGGASFRTRFASFNLGFHTEDDELFAVHYNRQRLFIQLELALGAGLAPAGTRQSGGRCGDHHRAGGSGRLGQSAAGKACVVMTADCLPVLLCDRAGGCVAAAHAGWRGLAAEIIAATVEAMHCPTSEVMAWLGPAIGPEVFRGRR
ncbi:MAG: laccase domain-containing protein [Gammaproteobacteria bacterium]